MARGLIILVVAAVAFWVFSIVDCAVQPETRHRGVTKRSWMFIVILLPAIGGILWFTIGRSRPNAQRPGPLAPDDDPSFLGSIGLLSMSDERIRRLQEDLINLAEEDEAALAAEDAKNAEDDGYRDDDPDRRDPRDSLS